MVIPGLVLDRKLAIASRSSSPWRLQTTWCTSRHLHRTTRNREGDSWISAALGIGGTRGMRRSLLPRQRIHCRAIPWP